MDDRVDSAQSERNYDGQMEALHRALMRKQFLLQRLREQHMLADLSRPHTWEGSRKQYQSHLINAASQPPPLWPPPPSHSELPLIDPAVPSLLSVPPPVLTQLPRIIQQTLPQQPATIVQQLPQLQPVITQMPHSNPMPRLGSIKEDMVELMLMQNAQMLQIIMHHMMLKAIPQVSPHIAQSDTVTHPPYHKQENPGFVKPDGKPRGNDVHHHHHYGALPSVLHLPPISSPAWVPVTSIVTEAQTVGRLPSIHHGTTSTTLPPIDITWIPSVCDRFMKIHNKR